MAETACSADRIEATLQGHGRVIAWFAVLITSREVPLPTANVAYRHCEATAAEPAVVLIRKIFYSHRLVIGVASAYSW
ncbi:hypothetical protein [Terriglobus albidus]|uniref:hypothetical protein n=1 Tax=Terriglobus albidus TaxID=1592106 RepID=UPI0021E0783F|nr:hypothetical protein [Terriglobus albidus]